MASLAWFVSDGNVHDCPADVFVRFLVRFGLFNDRHLGGMKIIPGGSHCYANAILARLRGDVRLKTEVESVRRTDEKVIVKEKHGFENLFDYVVIATHADEALRLLGDPTHEEKELLGAWTYARRKAVLHADESLMPPVSRAWSAWNCVYDPSAGGEERLTLTCHMNRLQRLRTKHPYFVTFQTPRPVDEDKIIREIHYTCPVFSPPAQRTQHELYQLNDPDGRTYFCGSYFGAGFHEDAVRSAFTALKSFCVTV
jgi:predicted NAD/FAD-binding protein